MVVTVTRLAAQPSSSVDPVAMALAGSSTARTGGAWLAGWNPAAPGSGGRASFAAAFSPSAIGIDGYREGYMIALLPLDSESAIGADASGMGAGAYRESTARLLGAITVAGIVRLGAALALHSLAIDGYGGALSGTIALGAVASLGGRARFGMSADNIARGRIAGTALPQRMAFGFALDLNGGLTLSADAWRESRRPAGGAIALSCSPVRGLALRGGIGAGPATIALGLGYEAGSLLLDYGGAYIAPLGLRHVVGAGIAF